VSPGGGLRDQVLALGGESAGVLGFEPRFFDGPVDSAIPDNVGIELLATLREALSNVARHAEATEVTVEVVATSHTFVLRIIDDGIGPPGPDAPRGHGLKNMEARAAHHAGRFEVLAGAPAGTVVQWQVPLAEPDPGGFVDLPGHVRGSLAAPQA